LTTGRTKLEWSLVLIALEISSPYAGLIEGAAKVLSSRKRRERRQNREKSAVPRTNLI
jgi:hypothetical protein